MFVSYARAAGLLPPRTYTLTLIQPGLCSALTVRSEKNETFRASSFSVR